MEHQANLSMLQCFSLCEYCVITLLSETTHYFFQLDQEINRLERLLELPIEPYPKLTDALLYLLPESRVDPTPSLRRRQEAEMQRLVKATFNVF